MHSVIGKTVKDRITGFTGVVLSRTEYITGCNQLLVQPKATAQDVSKMPDSLWIDEQRCEVDETQAAVQLNNGTTPGFDKQAPKI